MSERERESKTEGEGRERYTSSEHYVETLSRANLNTFQDRRLFQLNSSISQNGNRRQGT